MGTSTHKSGKLSPNKVTIRAYQVGFGDCFLLTFHYKDPKRPQRHVLIDCGTWRKSDADLLVGVAEDIRAVCKSGLDGLVVTHRHSDHLSGFGDTRVFDVIKGLKPRIVVQPWTEDPKTKKNAEGPTGALTDEQAFVRTMANVRLFFEALAAQTASNAHFPGQEGIANDEAVENLMELAKGGKGRYVYYGCRSGLESALPGVNVTVLGPPTLKQSKDIRKQRTKDPAEFWLTTATSGEDIGRENSRFKGPKFRKFPPETRWFVQKAGEVRGDQLLSFVRILDKQMNNTSVILLFHVGNQRLLFPGDAQIENWSYALKTAKDRQKQGQELKEVTVYKVGHHGSKNATPKTLWNLFAHKSPNPKTPSRLKTFLSTAPGVHGHEDKNTEVPRIPLVRELKGSSDLFSTDKLEDNYVCWQVDINISSRRG